MSKKLEINSVNDTLKALNNLKKEKMYLKNKMVEILDKSIEEDFETLYEKYTEIYHMINTYDSESYIFKCLEPVTEKFSEENVKSPEKLYEIADTLIKGFKSILNMYIEILDYTDNSENSIQNSKILIEKLNLFMKSKMETPKNKPISKEGLKIIKERVQKPYNNVKSLLKELELTIAKFELKQILLDQLNADNNYTNYKNSKTSYLDKLADYTINSIFEEKSKDIELNYELKENSQTYSPKKLEYLSRRYEKKGKQLVKDFEPVYRGEPKINDEGKPERKIIPSLFRSPKNFLKETAIFEDAVRHNSLEFEHQKTTFDKIALMQHYGIPTRLLDWSLNPLVALYFAVRKNPDNDARFIIYNPKSVIPAGNIRTKIISDLVYFSGDYTKIPLKIFKEKFENYHGTPIEEYYYDGRLSELINGVHVVYPVIRNDRLRVQSGCFTIHGNKVLKENDREFIDLTQVSDINFNKENMIIYKIPAKSKEKIKEELKLLGIHEGTIFPDLEHYGSHLRDKHGLDQKF